MNSDCLYTAPSIYLSFYGGRFLCADFPAVPGNVAFCEEMHMVWSLDKFPRYALDQLLKERFTEKPNVFFLNNRILGWSVEIKILINFVLFLAFYPRRISSAAYLN
jgi:hypothetical protein